MLDLSVFSALFVLLALSVFQMALILGAPLGDYAWGGSHKILPRKLRFASVFSIVIYAYLASVLLEKAGKISFIQNTAFVNSAMWVIVGYFILGTFMNGMSRSRKERNVMTPVALLLVILYSIVAMN